MLSESLKKVVSEHHQEGKTVALAMVVRREAPTSGKPGDKCVVTPSGNLVGWIGGGCTTGIVIKEALSAIKEQTPRLVRIQTDADTPEQVGVKNYKMTCMSGGTVEVYIEPMTPVSEIKIFGRSHIGRALCEIGSKAGFKVSIISDLADEEMFPSASSISSLKEYKPLPHPSGFVVVCTQGENDEGSLSAAIQLNPSYLGFVASRKKANAVFMSLKRAGVPFEKLSAIKTPAGLDIQAKTPDEVAISILAEIIQEKRKSEPKESEAKMADLAIDATDDLYINPVCKVPVQKSTAKHVLEHNGEKVYFCCDGCKVSFEKEPEAYIS